MAQERAIQYHSITSRSKLTLPILEYVHGTMLALFPGNAGASVSNRSCLCFWPERIRQPISHQCRLVSPGDLSTCTRTVSGQMFKSRDVDAKLVRPLLKQTYRCVIHATICS
jgi:hypothetical protein